MKLETFVVEITWLNRKYMDFGWGNGYVVIPKGHPLYEKDYDDIDDIEVNGGLTYSDYAKNFNKVLLPENIEPNSWIIGFDTSHSDDTLSYWSKERVEEEAKYLAEQIENMF